MEVQNQFVSDASHGLRIPIAAIVGLPVVVLGLVLTVFTGHRIKLKNKNGNFSEINEKLDTVIEKAQDFSKKI